MVNNIKGIRNGDSLPITIMVDGIPIEHVVKHSPTGMEWGYPGSGPSDAALSILVHIKGKEFAYKYYQRFKEDFLVKLPMEGFSIVVDVDGWLEKINNMKIGV